jgi:hypothetical protein
MILFLTPPITQVGKAISPRSITTRSVNEPVCAACAAATTQTIYAPLTQLDESSGTEINLNCRSAHALEVTPTFYTKNGDAFTGDTFEMGPAEVKTVDLKTLMPRNIRNRHDLGGMTLGHEGGLMEMWGQLRLLRVGGGDSTDITFVNIADKRSDVRDAVWAVPEHGSTEIAIGNLGPNTVTAKLQFSDGEHQEVKVRSFGTELVRRHRGQSGTVEAEGVRITSADGSGDLIPTGVVLGSHFSSSIRFYDTKMVAQQNLYATNFRLHQVSTKIVLRNTGEQGVIATPRLRPAQGNPNDFIDLSAITLAPHEIRSVSLDPISRRTQSRPDFDSVSIEVMNSGTNGSLIAALNGVDDSSGMSYDVPLRDSGGSRNLSGAYPWRLDGDVSTIVSITNAATVEAQFVVQINYPGGPYLLDPRKLPVGDTATFDLRKIRDQQIPDRMGHTIPRSVEGGQFRWFIHSGGHLIGRAEMLSLARGISSSYSCGLPCPPRYSRGYTAPVPVTVPVGNSSPQAVLEIDVDSYDNEFGPYSANVASAWSWDEDIATFDGSSVTGVSAGETGTTATVEFPLYVNWENECSWYGTNQTNVNGATTVTGTVSIGTVTMEGTTISSTSIVKVHVPVASSSGISSTNGTTLELSIVEQTGEFTLAFSPNGPVAVNLTGGQSHEYIFEVSRLTAPTQNQTCKLAAHLNVVSPLTAVNNDLKTDTITVVP